MKTKLKDMEIIEGTICPKGKNKLAKIVMFKMDSDGKEAKKVSFFDKVKDFWHGLHKNMDMAMTVDQTIEAKEAHDKWWKLSCAFEQSIMSILQDETADQASMLTESVMQFINRAKQLAPYLQDMYKAEGAFSALEAISEDVTKAGKQISTANMERLKAAMKVLHELMGMDMEEYEAMYGDKKKPMMEEKDKKKPNSEMKKSEFDDKNINKGVVKNMDFKEILKSLSEDQQAAIVAEIEKQALEAANKNKPDDNEVKKQLEDLSKANVDLAKALEVERDMRITKEFVEVAKSYKGLPVTADEFGKVLKELSVKAPDQYAELIKVLAASDELITKNNALMTEIGKGQIPESDAVQKMNMKAIEIQKASAGMSFEAAFAKALRENPGLYDEYKAQK